MEEKQNKCVFKGDSGKFIRLLFCYTITLIPIISILVMGKNWYSFVMVILCLQIPFLMMFYFLLRWLDQFTFCDESKNIVKPLAIKIPYDKIQKIQIKKTGTGGNIVAKKGRWQGQPILISMGYNQQETVQQELEKRFPGKVQIEQHSIVKMPVVIILICFILYGATLVFLHHRSPRIFALRSQSMKTSNSAFGRSFTLDGFLFSLPQDYVSVKKAANGSVFQSKKNKSQIIVNIDDYKKLGPHAGQVLKYGIGVENLYDLYHMVYDARFGLIPLFMKTVALIPWTDAQLYRIEYTNAKGYMIQGTRDGLYKTELVFVKDQRDIHFVIMSKEKINENIAKQIISGFNQK